MALKESVAITLSTSFDLAIERPGVRVVTIVVKMMKRKFCDQLGSPIWDVPFQVPLVASLNDAPLPCQMQLCFVARLEPTRMRWENGQVHMTSRETREAHVQECNGVKSVCNSTKKKTNKKHTDTNTRTRTDTLHKHTDTTTHEDTDTQTHRHTDTQTHRHDF